VLKISKDLESGLENPAKLRTEELDFEKHNSETNKGKVGERTDYRRQKTNLILSDDEMAISCPICLVDFQEGDTICWSHNPSCTHTFHIDCIEPWLMKHDRCPCCRNKYLVPILEENPFSVVEAVAEDSNNPVSSNGTRGQAVNVWGAMIQYSQALRLMARRTRSDNTSNEAASHNSSRDESFQPRRTRLPFRA
jgi:hypothetical protein